ncbi:hypothetical protein [Allosphingosinicella sp.]|jgi:hypothetical protein|uniref:hypothetical protein n=1 Tax=Allosphingosinicella sp. TaxID=2823234 RepID=UPI002EE92367
MSPHADAVASLYRPMKRGGWIVRRWGKDIPLRGYWSPARPVSDVISLDRDRDTWMSLMPVEVESQQIAVDCAAGHVAVFGLGLGWLAALCAVKDEVESVTAVECDAELIALHAELGLFERLPGGAGAKVTIVQGDAFSWRPDRAVDLLAADIWLPIVGGDRVADVRRMQANVGAARVYFWGQELEIARHSVAAGRRRLDDGDIADTVRALGLPLAGLDFPGYAERLGSAVDQWMGENWFSELRPEGFVEAFQSSFGS